MAQLLPVTPKNPGMSFASSHDMFASLPRSILSQCFENILVFLSSLSIALSFLYYAALSQVN